MSESRFPDELVERLLRTARALRFDDTGKSREEMQRSDLAQRGDCVRIWVNEGDWLAFRLALDSLNPPENSTHE